MLLTADVPQAEGGQKAVAVLPVSDNQKRGEEVAVGLGGKKAKKSPAALRVLLGNRKRMEA